MVKMLTDAVMCRKHPQGVKEAGDTNTYFHISTHSSCKTTYTVLFGELPKCPA